MNPPTDQNDVSTALGLLRDSLSEEEQRSRNEGAKAMQSGDYDTVAMHEEVMVDAGKHQEGGHSCPPESNVATGVSPLLIYCVTKKWARRGGLKRTARLG